MRRWVRFGGALVLAWLLFSGVCFWLRYMRFQNGHETLADAIAEIEESDHSWRWDDIEADREPIPDDRNLAEIAMRFDAERVTEAANWKKWEELQKRETDFEPNEKPPTQWLQAVAKHRPEMEPAFALVREMVRRGAHRVPYDLPDDVFSLSTSYVATMQSAAWLLNIEALEMAAQGRVSDTLPLIDDVLTLADSLRDEPFLFSQLVRIAIQHTAILMLERTLALGEPPGSAEALLALSARLAQINRRPVMLPAFRGERAVLHQLFENVETGKVPPATLRNLALVGGGTGGSRLQNFLDAPDLRFQHALVLQRLTAYIEILQTPRRGWTGAIAELPPLPGDGGFAVTGGLLTSAGAMIQSELEAHARLTCAQVAIACEIHRQRHGHWPENFTEISAELLPDPPADPSTGRALNLAVTPEGLVVHGDDSLPAVSRNRLGPRTSIRFRLWNPKVRGLDSSLEGVSEPER